jgi:ribosomal protein RSM22 (predicted rRNA methylase)
MLREIYREGTYPFLTKKEHRDAYMLTRFPATSAAVLRVLQEIAAYPIESLLDLGAGPGTGWLAAKKVFPHLKQGTLIEGDPQFVEIGKKLAPEASWEKKDLREPCEFAPHDLGLMSYSMGEIREWQLVILQAWKACQIVVVIEPGTPVGFSRIRDVRDFLIAQGGHILAPCPHAKTCPGSWCHFSVRLERSREHRIAKGGTLGYEDEKFSYIIVAKESRELHNRILRHPQKKKGHVVFELCTEDGLKTQTVSRKERNYKTARKLEWGDTLTE